MLYFGGRRQSAELGTSPISGGQRQAGHCRVADIKPGNGRSDQRPWSDSDVRGANQLSLLCEMHLLGAACMQAGGQRGRRQAVMSIYAVNSTFTSAMHHTAIYAHATVYGRHSFVLTPTVWRFLSVQH